MRALLMKRSMTDAVDTVVRGRLVAIAVFLGIILAISHQAVLVMINYLKNMKKFIKICLVIFYVIVWCLLLLNLMLFISAIFAIFNREMSGIKDWLIFILVIALPFFWCYILRNHFKILLKLIVKFLLFIENIKLTLPATILLGCIILGSFIYASQVSKQRSIEKQQEIKMADDRRVETIKADQTKKEYVVKRKKDCYDFETSERKKFNNVDGSFYDEENDVCKVRYVNREWREGDPNSCKLFENLFDGKSTCTIEHYFTNEF
jgi:hypothetical protein